jgi:hypothetical protein
VSSHHNRVIPTVRAFSSADGGICSCLAFAFAVAFAVAVALAFLSVIPNLNFVILSEAKNPLLPLPLLLQLPSPFFLSFPT